MALLIHINTVHTRERGIKGEVASCQPRASQLFYAALDRPPFLEMRPVLDFLSKIP